MVEKNKNKIIGIRTDTRARARAAPPRPATAWIKR